MILPEYLRLGLYVVIGVCPVWIDFFTKSTDYSLRGLAMPTLASILTAATVMLARTKSKDEPASPAPTITPAPQPQPPSLKL